jgi:hypothetical protein
MNTKPTPIARAALAIAALRLATYAPLSVAGQPSQPTFTSLLYIGAENWPFPIPLVSQNGVWRFDSDAGVHEIRYRRIGENELTCRIDRTWTPAEATH